MNEHKEGMTIDLSDTIIFYAVSETEESYAFVLPTMKPEGIYDCLIVNKNKNHFILDDWTYSIEIAEVKYVPKYNRVAFEDVPSDFIQALMAGLAELRAATATTTTWTPDESIKENLGWDQY